jgi:hypothetical protein
MMVVPSASLPLVCCAAAGAEIADGTVLSMLIEAIGPGEPEMLALLQSRSVTDVTVTVPVPLGARW